MNKDIQNIAIVRLSALGDIINSAVVLQFIKKEYPNANITWICEEMFSSILKDHHYLKNLHTLTLKELKKRDNKIKVFIENLKKISTFEEFDIIIDMQGLIKSAIVSRIIGKKTHGFDKNSTRESLASLLYKTSSSIPYEENVIKRNCFVVSDALKFKITDEMILNKDNIFNYTNDFKFSKDNKNIAFIIGASWNSKKYPKELVTKVCDTLGETSYIVWGSEDERKDALWICEQSKYAKLAPKMSLKKLVGFISELDLVIGNDTGPTHIAWAQNIPSITLFGPTNERMIYETPKNIAINSPSNVNILKIDKNDFSIKEIDYKEIVKNAQRLLKW